MQPHVEASQGGGIVFSFPAVVGCDSVKRALLLLAIDRKLNGALIAAPPGSGKSTLMSAFRKLLASVMAGRTESRFPVVQVPLNVTEDRLVGALDFEAALAGDQRPHRPGLLAEADKGLLCVENANLLPSTIAHQIAAAIDTGTIRIERDRLSLVEPARFIFAGTYDPQAGDVDRALLERVGLIIPAVPPELVGQRADVIERVLAFDQDPTGFTAVYRDETDRLVEQVMTAGAALGGIETARWQLDRLSLASLTLGVEGNAADIFALRAARANAALEGRPAVNDDDLAVAIKLVLAPRATITLGEEAQPRSSEWQHDENATTTEPPRPELDGAPRSALDSVQDLILRAINSPLPDGLLELAKNRSVRRSGNRANAGKASDSHITDHGRYSRSSSKADRFKRVALDSTLRAAAPFQRTRRRNDADKRLVIKRQDLQFKQLKRKSGVLFIFVVDASGSMALGRMAQVKGALVRVLQRAYLRRDTVALVTCRGDSARIILEPTRSVDVARRCIEVIPAGGGTPIAAGLLSALELARRARKRTASRIAVLLFTDGRANVGIGRQCDKLAIESELRHLGLAMGREEVECVLIDTRPRFASDGEGQRLADNIGARYVYLPRADSTKILGAIKSLEFA